MQFICHGPDVPERLLQAHEDGRVVFFCGAGISYPAGLPGFSQLVGMLYDASSVTPNPVQRSAIEAGQFDTAIGLLETDIVGGRETVRRTLATILTPGLTAANATATHEALLTLAKNRDGRLRLITTNFDRLFEKVRAAKSLSFPDFKAPLLPVPKSRWDGLVYLHGLLPMDLTSGDLDRLVVSSGDFGLAYLIERWAARFVSSVFRNSIVCFVGYSIDDPVLRYMMDALAADRLMGESLFEMFAFGSFSEGQETESGNKWKAKNVSPILYPDHNNHEYLHQTLHEWAAIYQEGVCGKERMVEKYVFRVPSESTKQDDFVGRMLWALSDLSGLPAKRFAELDPVPPLDWLGPLSQALYGHADLGRFGVPPQAATDEKLAYSLTSRPAPYPLAPWMALVDGGQRSSDWDEVMSQLARWLLRHLDDQKLLLWVIKQGGQLHDEWVRLIEDRLDTLDKLAGDGNTIELDRIQENAPNAIPRPAMRTLWRLLLNGQVKSKLREPSLYYRWHNQFKRDGLAASVRLTLRKTLAPCLSLCESLRQSGAKDGEEAKDRIRDIVGWEIVLMSDHVHSRFRELRKSEQWAEALPELLDDFSTLLRDALDLMRELGEADSKSDRSYFPQPSISNHSQNQGFHDWTVLIELARDAWLATVAKSPERARIVAEMWAHGSYPVFRRLAFFAATQGRVIPLRQALDWLLADERRWLWSEEIRRETIRLIVFLAPQLDGAMQTELEQAILSGSPPDLYRADIAPDVWNRIVDRGVWLRLAKMAQAGTTLSEAGQSRLDTLSAQYPSWQLAADERDEFLFWRGDSWVGRDPCEPFTPIPRTRRGVLDYLLAHPELDNRQQDDWRELCSEMFQATAYALCKLAQQNNWPVERWRDALQAWAEEKLRDHSWRYMAPVVVNMPDDRVQALPIGWWLYAVAKTFKGHEDHFLTLARRILQLDFDDDGDTDDPVFRAIDHPVGHVTQALLDWWGRQKPDDGQGMLKSIEPIFTELCDTQIAKFRHGRVLLAIYALSLFRVDKAWSEQHLLPLLDWNRSETEAQAAWEGFLWSPRLYRPLMKAIKPAFLDTANHYAKLGTHKKQFATFLTFAALDPSDTFTIAQLATAIGALPADGLRESTQALVLALESADDRREDYWKNRVLPFWEKIWPKSKDQASSADAESLVRLCIAAGNEFPSAMKTIGNWLQVVQYPDDVIHRLQESGLPKHFPEDALQLLFTIFDGQLLWASQELHQCLDAIGEAAPNLLESCRYKRVDELVRKLEI